MRESSFWSSRVRPQLHRPPAGVAWKVKDDAGLPDVLAVRGGLVALIELKYVPRWPVRDRSQVPIALTQQQRMKLSAWQRAGALSYVLLGVSDDWFLFGGTYDLLQLPPTLQKSELTHASHPALVGAGSRHELSSLPPLIFDPGNRLLTE